MDTETFKNKLLKENFLVTDCSILESCFENFDMRFSDGRIVKSYQAWANGNISIESDTLTIKFGWQAEAGKDYNQNLQFYITDIDLNYEIETKTDIDDFLLEDIDSDFMEDMQEKMDWQSNIRLLLPDRI